MFYKEAAMWRHLDHPNILPLLGVTLSPYQLVSNWMPGGDLSDYIEANPGADRLGLVRIPLVVITSCLPGCQLHDAAKGLDYLHSRNVIHGDLKGVCDRPELHFTIVLTPHQFNIVVDVVGDNPRACLADFGVTLVTKNLDSLRSATRDRTRAPRWSAPEILEGKSNPSRESDVFSFAMVMVEVRHGWPTTHSNLGSSGPFGVITGVHRSASIY